MTGRADEIARRLRDELAAEHVEVVDDSARHAGHAGARDGAGHYRVVVVSARFSGLDRVAAQRLVYRAVGDLMGPAIHALQIRLRSGRTGRDRTAGRRRRRLASGRFSPPSERAAVSGPRGRRAPSSSWPR